MKSTLSELRTEIESMACVWPNLCGTSLRRVPVGGAAGLKDCPVCEIRRSLLAKVEALSSFLSTTPLAPAQVWQPGMARMTWLAERVKEQHAIFAREAEAEGGRLLGHDSLTCAHPQHCGCHLYAFVTLAMRALSGPMLLPAPPAVETPEPDEDAESCEGCEAPATHRAIDGIALCKVCFLAIPMKPLAPFPTPAANVEGQPAAERNELTPQDAERTEAICLRYERAALEVVRAIKRDYLPDMDGNDGGQILSWVLDVVAHAALTESASSWGASPAPPFDPANHHNALACPYCNPDNVSLSKQSPAESVKAINEHLGASPAQTEPSK